MVSRRKRYASMKSQRFSTLAQSRWSKARCGTTGNVIEREDTVYTDSYGANPGDNHYLQEGPTITVETENRINDQIAEDVEDRTVSSNSDVTRVLNQKEME